MPGAGNRIAPGSLRRSTDVLGAWEALPIQLECDLLGASAAGVFAEDAAHDLGFFLDNRPFAPDRLAAGVELTDNAIAVGGLAAASLSGLHAPALAAMGLDGEVF